MPDMLPIGQPDVYFHSILAELFESLTRRSAAQQQ
jgi:hypothetical protein